MGWTGFDTPEPGAPIDMSGGGADPSYAWSLAPGGRFAGDEWTAAEIAVALGLDPATFQQRHGANPGYEVPGPLDDRRSILGWLLRMHENNVRNSGGVAPAGDLGYGTNHFFSGPGAPYGPYSGPTRGLVDQGVPPGDIFDRPEWRPDGVSTEGPAPPQRRHGGGGGGYHGPTGLPAYQGLDYHPQFLDWQPVDIYAGQHLNPHPSFTGGAGSSLSGRVEPAQAASVPRGTGGGGGRGGGGGQGGGGGMVKPGKPPAGGTAAGGGAEMSEAEFNHLLGLLQGSTGVDAGTATSLLNQLGIHPGSHLGLGGGGATNFRGYNASDIFGNAPGTFRDPTTGILNTAGMPHATPMDFALWASQNPSNTDRYDPGFVNLPGGRGIWYGSPQTSPTANEADYRDYLLSSGMSPGEVNSIMMGIPSSTPMRGPSGYVFPQQVGFGGGGAGGGLGGSGDAGSTLERMGVYI